MTLPATIDARVLVSWDGTGDFTGLFDDVTSDVLDQPGVSIDAGKDGARTLSPPKVVAADFEVWNQDGTYSQERADSPIYQLVVPGRAVSIEVDHGTVSAYDEDDPYDADDYYDGVGTYSLARTSLDDISQDAALGQERVSLATIGIEALLLAQTVTVPVMVAPRVDECIDALLDAAGWPAADRDIAVSDTQFTYWWCDDREPWSALLELLQSEGPGAIWVDGDGAFHFENRNYRTITDRSTTSQAAFFDQDSGLPSAYDEDDAYDVDDFYDGVTSGLWFTNLSYDPGYKNIRNRVTYTIKSRQLAALGVVWSYGASLVLGSGEVVTLIARPNDPFQNAVTPALTTDYTVSGGTVSVSLAATSGLVAFITVTATSGTPTVSGLQLRAQALTAGFETTIANSVDASASIAKFSPIPGQDIPRVLQVAGWPEINRANATAVCDAWTTRYMVPRPAVEITLRNADGAHVEQMLKRVTSDRITLYERNTGLSADVWINSKHLEIAGAGGRVFACVLGCEKVEEVGGSRWDVGLWGTAIWGT